MQARGELQIDPASLAPFSDAPVFEIAVLYSEPDATEALLRHTVTLTAGSNATIHLVAVHSVPYPRDFECPASIHAHLVGNLMALAHRCPLPVTPLVVLPRSREEGLQFAIQPNSTVLVGSRKSLWSTPEEKLARSLATAWPWFISPR
jgi:hypothetical protein